MSSLTTKYNTKLRAAQQRNKELRAELAKLQVRPAAHQACQPGLLLKRVVSTRLVETMTTNHNHNMTTKIIHH